MTTLTHGPTAAHPDFPDTNLDVVCRACSYTDGGAPLVPVPWPCRQDPAGGPRRLADAVTARRENLGLSKAQLAGMSRLSLRTVELIEDAAPVKHRPSVLGRLERGLGWVPDSAAAVVAGADPVQDTPAEAAPRLVSQEVPPEVRVVLAARLPADVEAHLLTHVSARRQDMDAVLVAEADLLVRGLTHRHWK